MGKCYFFVFFAFLLFSPQIQAQTFQQANAYYQQRSYQQALQSYQETLKGGRHSSAVYFNMANCYYRMEQWGKAIAYYEKAKRLSPSDSDIDFNLKTALKKRSYQTDNNTTFQNWWEEVLFLFPLRTWLVCVLVFSWVGTGFFFLYFYNANPITKRLYFSLGSVSLLFCVLSLFLGVQSESFFDRSEAIVIIKEGYVKSEPNEQSSNHFTVYEGMKVEVLSDQAHWLKISIPDGKVGWITQNTVQKI